ncbi:M28 family metallopeptidase [Nonomuraea pusilla]|uniref:Peptidase family M28 n=1 Tax=Nonomuraea pusilla TaxID=46177 RepID=A0A1H8CF19_9ACTN|nr:M28 family peptidase [Nonomuraea pusilla]SEM93616.1 Peptidase family M28 [Nonomuraea pusilla]
MIPDLIPGAARMMEWIETVTSRGIRRPGYPADDWTAAWAAERFTEFGLHGVRLAPVELPAWRPVTASLTVRLDADPSRAVRVAASALPYTTPKAIVSAPVSREVVPGAIVVPEYTFAELPQSYLRDLATAVHDPEGVFDDLVQTLPFQLDHLDVIQGVMDGGAAAFAGALTGVPWETRDYYVPYDAVHRDLPAVWLSGRDSRRVLDLVDEGPCTGTLTVESETGPAVSHNVIGTLPGRSDQWVIIGSHHDAPWASAVEDASGIALVLAAARYWAGVPERDRPHNLVFLLTAGHMAHAAGTRAFIEENRGLLGDVVLQLHLEHAARRCVAVDGELLPTGDPEPGWWFTTRKPELERLVAEAVVAEDLRRSFVLPPDVFSPMPPTDGAFFHPEGVPLVHFLSAPMYLFDSADTVDKVHEESLEPLTRAAVRIVEGTDGWRRA